MIEKDLFSALSAVAKTYPAVMPQDVVMPSMRYLVVYDSTDQCLAGDVSGRTVRVQVDVFARTYGEAKSLKQDVVTAVMSLGATGINAQDLYEKETQLHRQLINFIIKE